MKHFGSGNAQWRHRSLQHARRPCAQMQRATKVTRYVDDGDLPADTPRDRPLRVNSLESSSRAFRFSGM